MFYKEFIFKYMLSILKVMVYIILKALKTHQKQ